MSNHNTSASTCAKTVEPECGLSLVADGEGTAVMVMGQEAIDELLSEFIGKRVCVSWVKDRDGLRKNFEPQISVEAELEGTPETGRYRVLVSDSTYSYFYNDTVWMFIENRIAGTRPVIFIG